MAAPLVLRTLASTSPSIAEEMSICRLRAGLASRSDSESWVLHDPRLWLGTALHSVLEKARQGKIGPDVEPAWDAEIAKFVQRTGAHPFDKRFADPTRWPSYFLVRQRAMSAAAELTGARKHLASAACGGGRPQSAQTGTEGRLVAR